LWLCTERIDIGDAKLECLIWESQHARHFFCITNSNESDAETKVEVFHVDDSTPSLSRFDDKQR